MDCPFKPLNQNARSILFFFIGWIGFSELLWAQTIPVSLNWTSSTEGILFSSPTIDSAGKIYVGSNDNKLHAISSTDGSAIWTFTTGSWVDTTPALSHDESVVYFGSWDNKLYAVNVETGAEIWSFETNSYIQSSPAVGLDGKIYFGSMDSIFYALESDGSLAWEYFAGEPIFSSPAIGSDGTLYFGDENGTLHAVHSDGSVKWTYLVDEVTDTNRSILSSPTLDADGNLYFGSGNGYCYSISDDGSQATLNWKYLTGDRVDSSPVLGLNEEVFFVSRDGYMRSLPLFSATTDNLANWEVLVGDVFYSSPAVDENGRVYVIGYTGGGKNHLFAYDASGTKAWDSNVSSPPFEIPSVVDSSLLLSDDGNLYFGCFDKNLYSLSLGVSPANSDWPMFRRNSLRNGDWPSFSLTIQSSPTAGGTTTGAGKFYQGSSTIITATPNTGYSFNGWNGEGVSDPTTSSTFVNMTQDRSIEATFTLNSYELDVAAGDGGSASGSGSFSHGSSATITAIPDTGYSFTGWVGDGVLNSTSVSTSVSMTQNRSVEATFILNSYELEVSAGDGGSASGSGSFSHGSSVNITATPDTGYSFAGWVGDGILNSTSVSTSVSMTQNRSVAATFTINSYDLNISAGDGGSASGSGSFSHGSSATINANPDTGFIFKEWIGDGIIDPTAPSTFITMDQDRNISAIFTARSIDRYLLRIDSIPPSAGYTSGAEEYEFESNATISATPLTGYSFIGWSGEGIKDTNLSSTSVFMNQERNITANFSINFYDLKINSNYDAELTGEGSFSYGTEANISASPSTGYSFERWIGDGVVNPLAKATKVRMTEDRNISAVFSINSYQLEVSASNGGTVSDSGSFFYGTEANISASPSTGYSFERWTGDGVVDPTAETTQVRMTEDRNVAAVFSINLYQLEISASDGGIVSDSGSFKFGSYATIKATPQSGYSFLCWHGEGVSDQFNSTTEVYMNQDRSISASFTISLSYGLRTSPLEGNWYSSWLGIFYQNSEHWVYHAGLGWLFLTYVDTNLWLWTENYGWAWTKKDSFSKNFLWLDKFKQWVYLDLTNTQAPLYYDYQSESWEDW